MSADKFAVRGVLPDPSLPWPIDYDAVQLLAHFEQGPKGGVALAAYRCSAGVWTIGWGETEGVKPGDACTKEEADRWLCEGIDERAKRVRSLCKVEPGRKELGAMVSLSYNIGLDAFAKSSVLRHHNAGKPLAAARAFELWNKARNPATGKLEESAGLTRRRKAEAAMYLADSAGSTRALPQAVASESSLAESPLVKLGASIAGGGGLVGVSNAPTPSSAPAPVEAPAATTVERVTEAAGQFTGVAEAVQGAISAVQTVTTSVAGFLGITPGLLLAAAMVAAGAAVIYWRVKQRREGWV